MVVVDTSALACILLGEQKSHAVIAFLLANPGSLLPVSCVTEFSLARRLGERRHEWLQQFVSDASLDICGIPASVAPIAIDAARRFGKGSGHPAGLNFGDCLSYAFAKHRDLPLLYVGDDFSHTDIESALQP